MNIHKFHKCHSLPLSPPGFEPVPLMFKSAALQLDRLSSPMTVSQILTCCQTFQSRQLPVFCAFLCLLYIDVMNLLAIGDDEYATQQ